MKRAIRRKKCEYGFLLILAVGLAAIFLFIQGKGLFGSNVDWIAQHSVFPDYFRKLFYETGELYPDFAMEIGGGQNVFNFAYYGFLNPCILLAYLFPWIPMDLWIMGLSLIVYVASVLLFYYWMSHGKKVDEPALPFGITLIFMLAAPLLYHSSVQIMFVNYMPFLCMGLIGTDRYFEKGKIGLLCISVALMVLTSYYFSVGGIGCLCLYALYCYLKKAETVTIKGILWAASKYIVVIFGGILLSGFYLAPTAIALFAGRSDEGGSKIIDIVSLFLPFGDPERILYDNYGMGLGCLSLAAVAAGMFQKRLAEKVMGISLFLVTMFPVFTYLLNGFLYNREKALIPFIPLMCFQTGVWISSLKKDKRGVKAAAVLILLYFAVTLKQNENQLFYLFDFALVMTSIILYCKWKKNVWVIMIPAVFILLIAMGKNCEQETVGLNWSELNLEKREEISQIAEDVLEKDPSLYRMEYYGNEDENFYNINRIFSVDQNITSIYSSTFNKYYSAFRNKIFDVEKPNRNILMESLVENVVFRKLMGVKYIISDTQPVGYQKGASKSEKNQLGIYVDETAAPLVYGTSELLDSQEYEQLEFPYNQLAFLLYAVVENNSEERLSGGVNPEKKIEESSGALNYIDISKQIEGTPQGKIAVQIPKSDKDNIFFVQFRVKNGKNKDVVIKVGTSKNKLCAGRHIYYNENTVFSYAVAVAAGQEEIVFDFEKGKYEISDSIACLSSISTNPNLYLYEFFQKQEEGAKAKKSGEVLTGSINMETDGYLITSIPYDESFSALVDGRETEAEKVNEGFLGIRLNRGNHEVAIQYRSPGKSVGICMTFCGLLMIAIFMLLHKLNRVHR